MQQLTQLLKRIARQTHAVAVLRRIYHRLDYEKHVRAQRPYFGAYLRANQMLPNRARAMRALIQRAHDDGREQFSLLEIGSWAGSSAVLWAAEIKRLFGGGTVISVDPWVNYDLMRVQPEMRAGVQRNAIFPLYLHNIQTTKHDDVIMPIKAYSNAIVPYLKPESLDIVYIDGDHSYSGVAQDISSYAPLVKTGGYICGDDLEVQLTDVDLDFTEKNKSEDYVSRQQTDGSLIHYHPGVTLAVGEYFGSVSAYSGFWVMQKAVQGWKQVALSV